MNKSTGVPARHAIVRRLFFSSIRLISSSPTRRRVAVSFRLALLLGCVLAACAPASAQQYGADTYSGMRWRSLGPYRAGRVTAVAGIPARPDIYYMATPGGGVWKTTDGGVVWKPIFDDAHVASIGALALAPSNPDVVYAGTGEQTEGDGVYRSNDGGATWTNVGLKETHYISSIIVDPRDPDVVLVGAFGDFGPWSDFPASKERGIYKTTDGGKTWKQVLFAGDRVAVADMCAAPGDSRVVYATTWTRSFTADGRRGGGEDGQIYKSTDGGLTWQPLSMRGLPDGRRGRIGVAAAPGQGRVYAIMNQGFFRSDDAGESWTQVTKDPRVVGSWYFSRAYADPKNADVVYVMQTTMYRSTDGGKTFAAFKGGPSGEDEHVLWIAPDDSRRMILGSDQGATVSVDGGASWSIWYNQPTGQFYHVITDNQFPYFNYASQQDSGSVAVPNRSDYGQITFRDWFSTGSFESGYIAPDPADPNNVYSIGWYGSVLRLDRKTGQTSTVFVPGPKYRYTWETPLAFSPVDRKTLYAGMQQVLASSDGARTWREISPDLTVVEAAKPAEKTSSAKPVETVKPAETVASLSRRGGHAENAVEDEGGGDGDEDGALQQGRGVIEMIAPSAARGGEIWVGTSSCLVQLTRDGGATWQNVTPADAPPLCHFSNIEASPTDADTAYAVASGRDDFHPYVFRTRDAGKTWQKITAGMHERAIARAVREDPTRKGLVYAGTDDGVYVSFDGGDRWQSLQMNLPTTPVRDLTVHGDDLVIATYGRGLWVLDDLSALRQLDANVASADVKLLRPGAALRVRWDNWQETPLSAETPAGQNPPDGAIIYYYLKSPARGEVTLEIRDAQGTVVRRYTSAAPESEMPPANVPEYWFAPPDVLPAGAGLNRFVWDLRLPDPLTLPYGFYGQLLNYTEYTMPDHAVPGQTPRHQPPGPLVAPGNYEVVLTVGGKTYTQPLVVAPDPRLHLTPQDYAAQLELARKISDMMRASYEAHERVMSLGAEVYARLKSLQGNPQAKDASDAATALLRELYGVSEGANSSPGFGPANRDLARYLAMVESGDLNPAQTARDAVADSCQTLNQAAARWRKINAESVPALNELLKRYDLAPLPVATVAAETPCGN
jgi:photosystem II stability/assembly factor-like uncharacterized protein